MLKVEKLSKRFATYQAVDSISLDVQNGEIFGFLGPNGAGKTTTIKMLAGLLKPDAGSITINGLDLARAPNECKKITGYIPDRPFLYEKLTGSEFLRFIASLYGQDNRRTEENGQKFLELFDLLKWQDFLIESYSHGMRQKLIITAAFMLEPPLIIVDEPMVGLDPKSARVVKELFKEHARNGGAVFLSTHSMEVAEELCDRLAIIVEGKLIASGSLDSIRQQAAKEGSTLEDIFLQLTGAFELQEVIKALR
nr:ABC transporter ATP-binding protein [Desulfobulbaceae bacterium]